MPRRRAKRKRVSKTWYQVYADDIFPGQWIGETPANDPESLIGRNVEVVLRDITGDFMHEKYKLWFRIYKVDGIKAYARFEKEMLNRDYLRSIVQRRSSRIDVMTDSRTRDGHDVRVFTIIITAVRIRNSQKHAIRMRVDNLLKQVIPELTLEDLVKSYLFNEPRPIIDEIKRVSTKIAPIKYVELRKLLLMKRGEGEEVPEAILGNEEEEIIEGSAAGGGGGEEA